MSSTVAGFRLFRRHPIPVFIQGDILEAGLKPVEQGCIERGAKAQGVHRREVACETCTDAIHRNRRRVALIAVALPYSGSFMPMCENPAGIGWPKGWHFALKGLLSTSLHCPICSLS